MKKYLGILAVTFGFAASAISFNHKTQHLMANSYTYDLYGQPGQDNLINIIDPSNYTFAGVTSLGCIGSAHRCGVEDATDDGFGKPDFNKNYTVRTRD
ncbi:MAG: hypothetical protein ABIP35_03310 [Ginsengibacter sp.]